MEKIVKIVVKNDVFKYFIVANLDHEIDYIIIRSDYIFLKRIRQISI